jgi:hypothetical protein
VRSAVRTFSGTPIFAAILTAPGLFSVLSYLVEQRAKDIGVHMALGATMPDTAALVLSTLLRPVCIGLAIGIAVRWLRQSRHCAPPASIRSGRSGVSERFAFVTKAAASSHRPIESCLAATDPR